MTMRRASAAASVLCLMLVYTSPAFAHGFGPTYDIPIPLWLYLYGAAAAVVLAFLPLALFPRKERDAAYQYPRFDLFGVGPLRRLLTSRLLLSGLRLLSVGLFFVVVIAGLGGLQSGFNIAPTFVWVTWWVGFGFFSALVGNLWPLVNPWRVLFDWTEGLARRLGFGDGLELDEPYLEALGIWPAVGLYLVFVWFENVFAGSYGPRNIALFALAYSLITIYGMAFFGKESWLRHGEAFSVFFGLLGRFAPTEVSVKDRKVCKDCDGCGDGPGRRVSCYECFRRAAPEERELNLRPPAVGLGLPEKALPGGAAFVIVVLAGVTFDGLLETPLWLEIVRLTPATQTLGVVLLPLLFFGIYLGFVELSRVLGGGGETGFEQFAAAYAFSLVPIAIAYQMAHYYTYLLIQGQMIVPLISDPFGWGWNLFGSAGFEPRYGVVGAAFVWYSQVALIVAGHVIAVYLAHSISLRLLRDPGRALKSQLPMLVLMVLYTITSLWILAQPIVR
jgi:hypothetical protein